MRENCKSYEGSEGCVRAKGAVRVLKGSWHSDITNGANRTNKIGTTAEQNRFSDRLNKTNKATGQHKQAKQSKSKQISRDRPY